MRKTFLHHSQKEMWLQRLFVRFIGRTPKIQFYMA